MAKQPLYDVSAFNRLADSQDIPWSDRICLIEAICWGSKGWIDADLADKMNTQYASLMRKLGVKVSGGYIYVRQPKPRKAVKATRKPVYACAGNRG
jgi:hypothetical protein